jgi:hypothetical protein
MEKAFLLLNEHTLSLQRRSPKDGEVDAKKSTANLGTQNSTIVNPGFGQK